MPDLSGYRNFALSVFALALASLLVAPVPLNAEMIGLVKRVKSNAYGTPPGLEREQKFIRFPVVQDELLETSANGGMLLEFLDKTTLTLGPDSNLRLETFIYDPAANKVTAVLNFSVGLMRFVSGKLENAEILIKTPSALIGIRGSDAVISVAKDGATSISVISGVFSLSNHTKTDSRSVSASQSASVSARGVVGAVTSRAVSPPASLNIPATSVSGADVSDDSSQGGYKQELDFGLSDSDHDDHPDDHDDHPDDDSGVDHGDDPGHDGGADHGD